MHATCLSCTAKLDIIQRYMTDKGRISNDRQYNSGQQKAQLNMLWPPELCVPPPNQGVMQSPHVPSCLLLS